MKILVKGKVETLSLDRVKPAHMECEPTTGTTTQRKPPNKSRKSTATRTSSRNPQGPPRPGSADTPTSNGTRVNTKKSTAVRSNQKSATVPKQIDVKVNLSNRDNTYVAPHSRAPAASRANGNSGGLRTYSRIPLHLRGKTRVLLTPQSTRQKANMRISQIAKKFRPTKQCEKLESDAQSRLLLDLCRWFTP